MRKVRLADLDAVFGRFGSQPPEGQTTIFAPDPQRRFSGQQTADLAAVRADKKNRGDFLPADYVNRMLAGESALRVWREYRGLTLEGLAAKAAEHGVEVGKSHLSHIETGRAQASLALMSGLAKALGVPLDALI